MQGRVEIHEVESERLRGNPLGDPARRRVPVYLPPGYDDAGAPDAYPVLFGLAGRVDQVVLEAARAIHDDFGDSISGD